MKFSTDSTTGQEMICSGYPDDGTGEEMTWYLHPEPPWWQGWRMRTESVRPAAPVGEPPYTFGRSSDQYAVWCYSGPRALMPGLKWLSTPNERSVWALYSP